MQLTERYSEPSLLQRLDWQDWLFAILICVAAGFAWHKYNSYMDSYEQGILWLTMVGMIALGWYWKVLRLFMPIVGGIALFAALQYKGDLATASTVFWLKYLIASQPAIMWMSALFFLATGAYWLALLSRSTFAAQTASALTWAAAGMGFIGMLVRWYESYLLGPDVGHIPVSNLYEVFVLFCLITALLYLYY